MKTSLRTTILIVSLLVSSAASLSAVDRGLGNTKSVYIPKGTVAFSHRLWKDTLRERYDRV